MARQLKHGDQCKAKEYRVAHDEDQFSHEQHGTPAPSVSKGLKRAAVN
jgi:hypothetical protein